MITAITGTCSYEGCTLPATHIACGRAPGDDEILNANGSHPLVACYCEEHGSRVADEQCPEYVAACPNCGCGFGVK